VGIVLALGFFGINLVILIEAHEWVETSWAKRRRRFFSRVVKPPEAKSGRLPKVSIHVPVHNEPPDMLKGTLNDLSQLDYPNFEVLIIDNNTKDPDKWQPVAEYCQTLGERFRFFHVDPLRGYKAGALNFALANMSPDAEVVAVIDSDYQVKPTWLKDLVPILDDPDIGFVQAPQDYRDGNESLFKTMCYAEYRGFFHIGMVTRNDRNAIIEHGTMTIIRASVMKRIGGWAEWCITEDAELGLRIMEHGYQGAYVEESYGKGLIPDTFTDYKRQRYRWAYGAIQILKRHRRALFSNEKTTHLSIGQRYHFVAGWLPWVSDSMNLFYTFGAIFWSVLMMHDPRHVDPPLAIFMFPPLALFCFKIMKLTFLYRTRIKSTRLETLAAAMGGLALSHTISKAILTGIFSSEMPFFRTPKGGNRPALVNALSAASEEAGITVLLWMVSAGVVLCQPYENASAKLWSVVLLIQSLPYLATLIVSLTNALPMRLTKAVSAPINPVPVK
jgi:cellulose synthase/poly-beta-1,6-N-acetylglucosamine synthase-like glycosyltransferase